MKEPIKDHDLLHRYTTCVRVLRMSIKMGDAVLCASADKKRGELHDEVLKSVGTTREDKEFAFELASWLEHVLDQEDQFFHELKELT